MKFRSELGKRIEKVRAGMAKESIGAIFVSKPENVLYLTGRETGRLILTGKDALLWVKDVYIDVHREFYRDDCPFDVKKYESDSVGGYARKIRSRKMGIENVSVDRYRKLKREFRAKLVTTDIVESARAVKSDYELRLLRKSASIAKIGMKRAYEVVKSGTNEMDAVAEIEYTLRKHGSEAPPFCEGMLLSSGKSSADIHGIPRSKKIKEGPVVVDLGARYGGYHSDMTRTIGVGKLKSEERGIVRFVAELQREITERVKVGARASDIHDFAESEMEKEGYKFYHATGHGIGLMVHEKPNLAKESDDVLKAGMVFTIEPGIYLPGKFGVRFEDTVLLKKSGVEMLTAGR